MGNALIQTTVKIISVGSLVVGLIGCVLYYFNGEAEMGNLVGFFVFSIGIFSMLLLIVILFFGSYRPKDRRVLFRSILMLITSYLLLIGIFVFADEYKRKPVRRVESEQRIGFHTNTAAGSLFHLDYFLPA